MHYNNILFIQFLRRRYTSIGNINNVLLKFVVGIKLNYDSPCVY